MVTSQQVKHLAFCAVVAGIAVMGLSSKVEANSEIAGVITFLTGFGLATVGVIKLERAAKTRG